MDSDYVVLVTEPTPFGFHDFKLAWEAFSGFGKPMGAVVNRAGLGDDSVQRFCKEKNLPVLAEVPFDRKIAEAYSRGECIANIDGRVSQAFADLRDAIQASEEGAVHA
jgi:MinD superfamily P-loop ATPase